jgi:hypothetical protein
MDNMTDEEYRMRAIMIESDLESEANSYFEERLDDEDEHIGDRCPRCFGPGCNYCLML